MFTVAFILLQRGIVKTAEEAYALIKKNRSVVHWTDSQMEFVKKVAPRFLN